MSDGLLSKGCPKCNGNLFLDRDYNGWYEWCLQCGYQHDLQYSGEVREKVRRTLLDRMRRVAKVS